jgi:hypothetical protein
VLYSGSSTNGNVYAHDSQTHEIRHAKHSDFSGTFTDARYIPTDVGGDANYPVIEIARTETIDELTGTIDDMVGSIDRDSLTGSYVSPALYTGASSYDKLYWNESLLSAGDNVTIAVRSATSDTTISSASWSSEYSDPSGSDISAATADDWTQYRISLTTDDYDHSPNLYNYVRLTYFKEPSTSETSIPLHWRSGYLDLGVPAYRKTLRKFYCYHSGSSGTLSIKFTMLDYNTDTQKYDEVTDTFNIDLSVYPNFYTSYFTNGALSGELLRVDITNDDLNPLTIDRIIFVMDGEPLT